MWVDDVFVHAFGAAVAQAILSGLRVLLVRYCWSAVVKKCSFACSDEVGDVVVEWPGKSPCRASKTVEILRLKHRLLPLIRAE